MPCLVDNAEATAADLFELLEVAHVPRCLVHVVEDVAVDEVGAAVLGLLGLVLGVGLARVRPVRAAGRCLRSWRLVGPIVIFGFNLTV